MRSVWSCIRSRRLGSSDDGDDGRRWSGSRSSRGSHGHSTIIMHQLTLALLFNDGRGVRQMRCATRLTAPMAPPAVPAAAPTIPMTVLAATSLLTPTLPSTPFTSLTLLALPSLLALPPSLSLLTLPSSVPLLTLSPLTPPTTCALPVTLPLTLA